MSKYKQRQRSFIQKQNQNSYERSVGHLHAQKSYNKEDNSYSGIKLGEIRNGVNHQIVQDDTYEQYASPLVNPFDINMESTKKMSSYKKRPVQNQQTDFNDKDNYKYDKYDKLQLKQFKQNLRIQHATNMRAVQEIQINGNEHKRESAKRIQFESKITNIQKIGCQIDSLLGYFRNGNRSKIIQKAQVQPIVHTKEHSLSPYRKLQQNVMSSTKYRARTPLTRQKDVTPRNNSAINQQKRQRLYQLSPLNKDKKQISNSYSNKEKKYPALSHNQTDQIQSSYNNKMTTKAYRQVEQSEIKQHESSSDLQFYFQSLKKLEAYTKEAKKPYRKDYNYDYTNYKYDKQLKIKNGDGQNSRYEQKQRQRKTTRPFITQDQIESYKDMRINNLKHSQILKQSLIQSQSLSKMQKIKQKYLKDGRQIQEQNSNSFENENENKQHKNQNFRQAKQRQLSESETYKYGDYNYNNNNYNCTPSKSSSSYNFKKQIQKSEIISISIGTPSYRNQQNRYRRYEDTSNYRQQQSNKKVDTCKIDNQIMKIRQKLQESKEQKHILKKKYEQIMGQEQGKMSTVHTPSQRMSAQNIKKSQSQSKIKYIEKATNEPFYNISANQVTAVKNNQRLYEQESRLCQKQFRKFQDDERTIVNNTLPQNSYKRSQKKEEFKLKLQRVEITKHQITKLASLLSEQIQIDQKLRGQRQKFCLLKNPQKWQKLAQQLKTQGHQISAQQIQKLLLITSEQHNPFDLPPMTGLSLQNQINSLKSYYIQAQKHYKQKIMSTISKQNLQKQNFSIKDLDLNSKGYLSIQDLVCFINLYTGRFYRNRDIILIVKRLLHNQGIQIEKNESMKVQFECLMKQFTKN